MSKKHILEIIFTYIFFLFIGLILSIISFFVSAKFFSANNPMLISYVTMLIMYILCIDSCTRTYGAYSYAYFEVNRKSSNFNELMKTFIFSNFLGLLFVISSYLYAKSFLSDKDPIVFALISLVIFFFLGIASSLEINKKLKKKNLGGRT